MNRNKKLQVKRKKAQKRNARQAEYRNRPRMPGDKNEPVETLSRYWIAINQSSCAMCTVPVPGVPEVSPKLAKADRIPDFCSGQGCPGAMSNRSYPNCRKSDSGMERWQGWSLCD